MTTRARATPDLPHRMPSTARMACIVSTYHEELTGAMLASALETLGAAGIGTERVQVVRAPGAFELPLLAHALATRDDVAAVLCFGLVLKGETEHDRYISDACAHGLVDVALETGKPVLFGVLLGIISAFFNVFISGAIFILVAIIWIIPDRRIEKALIKENANK
jgi:6,7-dimethyl-8-ribityllumazine synthase